MPRLVFKDEADRLKHNEHCRVAMKKHYHEKGGKVKQAIRYYKKKYPENAEVEAILGDINLELTEKLKQIKAYHINQKLQSI